MRKFEIADPNPEFLIKSIAEQGYSFETAIADLLDNSIYANASNIEILTDLDSEPFKIFIADDGKGMNSTELFQNLRFPSNSPENKRKTADLGRFGLGLKMASFSQTRKFTVLSRSKNEKFYSALTWDVEYLKECGEWRIIVNEIDEISNLLRDYRSVSNSYLSQFKDYEPNTIIVWEGLFKFESFLRDSNKKNAVNSEISNTSQYLSIVFHRFLEREIDPIKIRINNFLVQPFNPFPNLDSNTNVRSIETRVGEINNEKITLTGYILPKKSILESKQANNIWTPLNKNLMDMEGIYVYRTDRLIQFGHWNETSKSSPKHQLARLKVDVGNNLDQLLHLDVSKSKIEIPFELERLFEDVIIDLKNEAQKEFYNHLTSSFVSNAKKKKTDNLFSKIVTNKGVSITLNQEYPLLEDLKSSLNKEQIASLNFILKMCTNLVNSINQNEKNIFSGEDKVDGIKIEEVLITVKRLIEIGTSKSLIKNSILPNLGFEESNIPTEIQQLLD